MKLYRYHLTMTIGLKRSYKDIQEKPYIYIYIYKYICMCVCVKIDVYLYFSKQRQSKAALYN